MSQIFTRKIPVGPDGFVRLVDTMGTDRSILAAARVTASNTRQIHSDRGLLRFLMRHDHLTPFEMCEICLHVRVPMDVWRQWVRHRTASINEVSTRYGALRAGFAHTATDEWRLTPEHRRDGSGPLMPASRGSVRSLQEGQVFQVCQDFYDDALAAGVAPEMARKALPLATYTEAYWKIDARNLLHFLRLRLAPEAQMEIRQFAQAIAQIFSEWLPLTWEAFEDYQLDAVTLTGPEIQFLRGDDTAKLSIGEHTELARKLDKLAIPALRGTTDADQKEGEEADC